MLTTKEFFIDMEKCKFQALREEASDDWRCFWACADCAWFVEMQVLCEKLDKKINELVKYANEKEDVLEQHEMEDK